MTDGEEEMTPYWEVWADLQEARKDRDAIATKLGAAEKLIEEYRNLFMVKELQRSLDERETAGFLRGLEAAREAIRAEADSPRWSEAAAYDIVIASDVAIDGLLEMSK